MEDWVLWMIAVGALTVGEILTMGFFLGPIAVAALVTALAALLGAGLAVQLVIFTLLSIASILVLRPIARRHLHAPARVRTGTAALVGARAVVLEEVSAHAGTVKIGGEVWTARPFDEDEVIEEGARVEVLKIDGATALVSE
jgi:membrane protein implicated in regulation of membrane protease activity